MKLPLLVASVVLVNGVNLAFVVAGMIYGPTRATILNAFSLGVALALLFAAWRRRVHETDVYTRAYGAIRGAAGPQ